MKKYLFPVLIIALWSCAVDTEPVWFNKEYKGADCTDCPNVLVSIPDTNDTTKLALAVTRSLREEIIATLDYNDIRDPTDIPEAIFSFGLAYQELINQFPDEQAGWEAKIIGEIVFENENLLTIKVDTYTYTGGAHGLAYTRFLNFDKQLGEEVDAVDFFTDIQELTNLAEIHFRKMQNLPLESGINDTGFMFEGDQFYLPQNMGFTKSGLELIYNTYEVASYADGEINISLTWKEIEHLLKTNFRPVNQS